MYSFLGALLTLAIFVFGYRHVQNKLEADKKVILLEAQSLTGKHYTHGDINLFSTVQWEIDNKTVTSYLAFIEDVLYIKPLQNDFALSYPVSQLIEVAPFNPDVPYIMNLNMAAVLANEATRREIGESVYCRFQDESGHVTDFTLGHFRGISARDCLSKLRDLKVA